MAFRFRRTDDGDSMVGAKNFPLNSTYAATAKVGDVVTLNGSQEVALAATGDTAVLGVVAGFVFEGAGQAFKTAQVYISSEALYEADVVNGTPTLGTAYGIDGSSNLDVSDTTTKVATVVEIVNGKPYVRITARQLG